MKTHLIPQKFLTSINIELNDVLLRTQLKTVIDGDQSNPPLHFAQLTAPNFVVWLRTLRKSDGTTLGYSSLNTHRAGLFNLFRMYHVSMSSDLVTEIANHFKALKRKIARETGDGIHRIKTGKDPLTFSFYQFLCSRLLSEPKKEFTFTRTFMILC